MADRTVVCKFRYTAELVYTNTKVNKIKEIKNECLKSFIIDHNYEVNNMPIIYMVLNLDKSLADDMILNCDNGFITFTLYKYDDLSDTKLSIECFRKQFTYFIPNDINKNDEIDYNDTTETEHLDNTYCDINLGLMCINHINDNKKSFNLSAKNTTMYDCVKHCTSHFKNIVIEPFNYNDTFEQLILPPKDSVSKTLEFLNNYRVFYNTPYRYYNDFDCAYIISSSGRPVLRNKDIFDSVIINIKTIINDEANDPGIIVNKTKGNYQVVVSYLNATVYDNNIIKKSKTKIKGITSTTDKTISLKNDNSYNTEKVTNMRINNDNINMIDNIAYDANSSNVYICLNKNDLDTDAFNLNMRYSIHNIERYQDKDGDYLLTRKREIYLREDDTFVMNSVLNFRKTAN